MFCLFSPSPSTALPHRQITAICVSSAHLPSPLHSIHIHSAHAPQARSLARFTRPLLHPPADLIQARPLPPWSRGGARDSAPGWAFVGTTRVSCPKLQPPPPSCCATPKAASASPFLFLHSTSPRLRFVSLLPLISFLFLFLPIPFASCCIAYQSFLYPRLASIVITDTGRPSQTSAIPTTNVNTASSRLVSSHSSICLASSRRQPYHSHNGLRNEHRGEGGQGPERGD